MWTEKRRVQNVGPLLRRGGGTSKGEREGTASDIGEKPGEVGVLEARGGTCLKEDSVINSGKMCTYVYREDPVEKGKIDTIGGRRENCCSDFLKYRRGGM